MSEITFNREFIPAHGEIVKLSDQISRITAANRGPMTFEGTNTYLIGSENLAIIDPGPIDEKHLNLILKALSDRPLTHIFVSHTHADHSPLARELKFRTGAKIYAEGRHRAARELIGEEQNSLSESIDYDFNPDVELADGEVIDGGDWQIEAVHTPGHTANHCAFAYIDQEILFSADHVMAWSTSFVGPPDGAMSDYMSSLDKLIEREDQYILPGHGPEVIAPKDFLKALKKHRKAREALIFDEVKRHPGVKIPQIVDAVYPGLDQGLVNAARLSTLAHLEDLVERGEISTEGKASPTGSYHIK